MKVRIRLRMRPSLARKFECCRELAGMSAALLTPAAVMAFVLGLWRLTADLQLTGDFIFSSGLLSHWQVWVAVAAALEICALILNRFGKGSGEAIS